MIFWICYARPKVAKRFGEIEEKIDDFERVEDIFRNIWVAVKPTLNKWTNMKQSLLVVVSFTDFNIA